MINPEAVATEAIKLINTPYQHQGRKAGIGIDCIGVPIVVARNLNLSKSSFDEINYRRIPDGTLLKKIETVCQPIVIQQGAILVFKISAEAQHCAIFTGLGSGGDHICHAWDIAGKVVHHRIGMWKKKVVGVYGLPGVNYE